MGRMGHIVIIPIKCVPILCEVVGHLGHIFRTGDGSLWLFLFLY